MTPSTEPSIFDLLEPLSAKLIERGGPDIRAGFARATGGVDLPYLIDVLSERNGSQMLPEAAGVTDMSLVERVVDAIGACMVGSSLEEQAIAALEASGHAELVEALLAVKAYYIDANPTKLTEAQVCDMVCGALSKHTGEQS